MILDTKTSVWGYLAMRAAMVCDQSSYELFRRDMIGGGFMQPEDLPEEYTLEMAHFIRLIETQAPLMNKRRGKFSENRNGAALQ